MLEILKTLIERLISWPVAALVLCILFRKSVSRLIDRIDKGKFAGIEVSTRSAIDQLVGASAKSANDDQLSPVAQAQVAQPQSEEDLAAKRAMVLSFGGDQPLVLHTMQSIADTLGALGFTPETADTAPLLVRHLAVTQIFQAREVIYRLIFGSQIAALKLLMTGPKSAEALQSIYEKAVAMSPDYFSTYKFDNWLGFLVQFGIATPQGEGFFATTELGIEFVNWLFVSGLGEKPH